MAGTARDSGTARWPRRATLGLGLALLAVVLAGCEADPEQRFLCERLIAALEADATRIEVGAATMGEPQGATVRVDYSVEQADGRPREGWILCRFAGGALDANRLDLVGVETSEGGALEEMSLFWLRRWLAMTLGDARDPRFAARDGPPTLEYRAVGLFHPLYFAQQTVNAIVVGCVYSLLAIGFTLIYAIIGKINFAFGEFCMIAAVGTAIWATFLAAAGLTESTAALLLTLVVGLVTAAAFGWTAGQAVFRPLRAVAGHAPLIAAIGLSIALQEAVRLLHGAGDLWIAPDYGYGFVLVEGAGFALTGSWKQVVVVAATAAVYAGLGLLFNFSRFGRSFRACADDAGAAALMGINIDRVMLGAFAIGGAMAGLAGFALTEYYGVANFFMGFMIGFKALTAAILGGIGSVGGAIVGGFAIAFLETFWSGYLAAAYRDVAVFGVLALVLIFRPSGLLGREKSPFP